MQEYSFVTVWKIKAPPEAVWQAIRESSKWTEWWKGVRRVEIIAVGEPSGIGHKARYTWKGALPYSLAFFSEVVAVEYLKRIEVKASGELKGSGVWRFTTEGDWVTARYEWNVATAKWWMNLLAPFLGPMFKWNHDIIMHWGAEGIAGLLDAPVIERENHVR